MSRKQPSQKPFDLDEVLKLSPGPEIYTALLPLANDQNHKGREAIKTSHITSKLGKITFLKQVLEIMDVIFKSFEDEEDEGNLNIIVKIKGQFYRDICDVFEPFDYVVVKGSRFTRHEGKISVQIYKKVECFRADCDQTTDKKISTIDLSNLDSNQEKLRTVLIIERLFQDKEFRDKCYEIGFSNQSVTTTEENKKQAIFW
jgi:hypothetical protein